MAVIVPPRDGADLGRRRRLLRDRHRDVAAARDFHREHERPVGGDVQLVPEAVGQGETGADQAADRAADRERLSAAARAAGCPCPPVPAAAGAGAAGASAAGASAAGARAAGADRRARTAGARTAGARPPVPVPPVPVPPVPVPPVPEPPVPEPPVPVPPVPEPPVPPTRRAAGAVAGSSVGPHAAAAAALGAAACTAFGAGAAATAFAARPHCRGSVTATGRQGRRRDRQDERRTQSHVFLFVTTRSDLEPIRTDGSLPRDPAAMLASCAPQSGSSTSVGAATRIAP